MQRRPSSVLLLDVGFQHVTEQIVPKNYRNNCNNCAHCLWSCYWAPLKSASLHFLCSLPSGLYTHRQDLPWAFSAPGWGVPAHSAFPRIRNTPVPESSQWLFAGLSPICAYLPHSGELRTGPSTSDVASPVLRRGEGSHPSTCLAALPTVRPRPPLAFYAARPYCWLMFSLVHQDPQGPFCQTPSQPGRHQPVLIPVVVHPQVQDFAIPLAEF